MARRRQAHELQDVIRGRLTRTGTAQVSCTNPSPPDSAYAEEARVIRDWNHPLLFFFLPKTLNRGTCAPRKSESGGRSSLGDRSHRRDSNPGPAVYETAALTG